MKLISKTNLHFLIRPFKKKPIKLGLMKVIHVMSSSYTCFRLSTNTDINLIVRNAKDKLAVFVISWLSLTFIFKFFGAHHLIPMAKPSICSFLFYRYNLFRVGQQ